jgi:hypothetical protein
MSEEPRTTKTSAAQVEALIRANKWWPFDRVDGKILQRMHRSTERQNQTTDVEEALL